MFRHPDPEVLVVGAGPVGLAADVMLENPGSAMSKNGRSRCAMS